MIESQHMRIFNQRQLCFYAAYDFEKLEVENYKVVNRLNFFSFKSRSRVKDNSNFKIPSFNPLMHNVPKWSDKL